MATALRRWRMRRTADTAPPGVSTTGGTVGSGTSAPVGEALRAGVRGLHGRARHVGDRRPLHVLRAEGVRRSGPRPSAKRLAQLAQAELDPLDRRVDLGARRHDHEAVGVLAVLGRRGEVALSIEAEERRHVVVAGRVEEASGPAQHGRRVADGAERVAHVVLAVAEGPLAVLPRLAPVDGSEAEHEDAPGQQPRQRGPGGGRPPLLEDVVAAQVVVHARGDAIGLGDEQVALGRVEVAARGVGAQRPPGAAVLLPRGEAERQLEEGPERRPAERARRDRARPVEIAPGGREVVACQRELDARGARVGPERLRLVRPVEAPGPGSEAVRVMRAALVVAENGLEPTRAGHPRSVRRHPPGRGGWRLAAASCYRRRRNLDPWKKQGVSFTPGGTESSFARSRASRSSCRSSATWRT